MFYGASWVNMIANSCAPGDINSVVDPDDVEEIRDSLANVTHSGKQAILKSLDEIERK
jgi:hypothetical protein